MKNKVISSTLLSLFSFGANADDIDLFVKHNVNVTEKPRVMLIFDTSGSMAFSSSTGRSCGYNYSARRWRLCPDNRLGVAKNAILGLIDDNPNVDFGLMRFNSNNEGGYILSGIGKSSNEVKSKVQTLEANGGTPLSETLYEAYLYITGKATRYARRNASGKDTSVESGGRYISPFKPKVGEKRCNSAVNLILMTDGDPSADSSANSNIRSLHNSTFGGSVPVVRNNYMPALAEATFGRGGANPVEVDLYPSTADMKDIGYIYTIGFGTGMSAGGENILRQTAQYGGGKYYQANTAASLKEDFSKIISDINQRNSSFVSPSVSMNSADQTQSGNAMYYTMFLPEKHTRWQGNLKKLKMDGNNVVDMSGGPGLDSDGALINPNATTFWSTPGSKDGNNIKQGGVNHRLLTQTSRKLYSDFNKGRLIEFKYQTAQSQVGAAQLRAKLGTANDAETKQVMRWVAGEDVLGENSTSNRRADIFGDPLHSQPVSMDYGSKGIRVFVGTNAGVLHAFNDKGNNVDESWAFLPDKLLNIHKPLMNKKANTKLYGVDGLLSVFHKDINRDKKVNGQDKVWLFVGLRRGGKAYYGLDITSPDSPKLLWNKPITPQKTGFEELGQTWSKPKITYIRSHKEKPVIIFGAGYDDNKDNVAKTDDNEGRGVFIVDAESGNLIWSLTPNGPANNSAKASRFNGRHSIAADVSFIDSDYDGFTDKIYAADTGGSIWRIDMPKDEPNDEDHPWTHFKFAQLSDSGIKNDRRFFYQPNVVRTYFSKVTEISSSSGVVFKRKEVPYDAIVIGSGNRADPLEKAVENKLYVLRDENTITRSFDDSNRPSVILNSDLINVNSQPFYNTKSKNEFYEEEARLGRHKGWQYELRSGEKSLAKARIIEGVAYFTSFKPVSDNAVDECSVGSGNGSLYALHLHYGARVFKKIRYNTLREVPSTPVVVYNKSSEKDGVKNSVGRIHIQLKPDGNGEGLGPDGSYSNGSFAIVSINGAQAKFESDSANNPVPDFLHDNQEGLKTIRKYIYKLEQNDEN